jgi:hypothetical protein
MAVSDKGYGEALEKKTVRAWQGVVKSRKAKSDGNKRGETKE